jgi:hypothetical protein
MQNFRKTKPKFMNKLTRAITMLFMVMLINSSCERDDLAPVNELARLIIESEQFKNLHVDPSLLAVTKAPAELPSRIGRAVVISFKDQSSYQKVIGYLNEKNEVVRAMFLSVESSERPEDISQSMQNGTFNGKFVMQSDNTIHSLRFAGSKAVDLKTRDLTNANEGAGDPTFENPVLPIPSDVDLDAPIDVAGCGTMRSVYYCIAESINGMGPFSTGMCWAELPICMAVLAADCMYEGCPAGGV